MWWDPDNATPANGSWYFTGRWTLGRLKCAIRDPISQHLNNFMRLNADNCFMLCVFLNCVSLVLCNMLIFWLFVSPQNYENLYPNHERPSLGLSCGCNIYMAKAVLEYFVRRVVTHCLEISFQRALPTVLTTNRGNAMIMWRDCNWYHFF
jgi:hypothetical protein